MEATRTISISSPSEESVLMRCSSKTTATPNALSSRTVTKRNTVFRANREMDFVKIRSICPFRASSIMRANPGRSSFEPEIPPHSAQTMRLERMLTLLV